MTVGLQEGRKLRSIRTPGHEEADMFIVGRNCDELVITYEPGPGGDLPYVVVIRKDQETHAYPAHQLQALEFLEVES